MISPPVPLQQQQQQQQQRQRKRKFIGFHDHRGRHSRLDLGELLGAGPVS
ncbi:hypothetical protein [Polyangium fumosum]|nr:hypothetical protein [Polyangium fumosum]